MVTRNVDIENEFFNFGFSFAREFWVKSTGAVALANFEVENFTFEKSWVVFNDWSRLAGLDVKTEETVVALLPTLIILNGIFGLSKVFLGALLDFICLVAPHSFRPIAILNHKFNIDVLGELWRNVHPTPAFGLMGNLEKENLIGLAQFYWSEFFEV